MNQLQRLENEKKLLDLNHKAALVQNDFEQQKVKALGSENNSAITEKVITGTTGAQIPERIVGSTDPREQAQLVRSQLSQLSDERLSNIGLTQESLQNMSDQQLIEFAQNFAREVTGQYNALHPVPKGPGNINHVAKYGENPIQQNALTPEELAANAPTVPEQQRAPDRVVSNDITRETTIEEFLDVERRPNPYETKEPNPYAEPNPVTASTDPLTSVQQAGTGAVRGSEVSAPLDNTLAIYDGADATTRKYGRMPAPVVKAENLTEPAQSPFAAASSQMSSNPVPRVVGRPPSRDEINPAQERPEWLGENPKAPRTPPPQRYPWPDGGESDIELFGGVKREPIVDAYTGAEMKNQYEYDIPEPNTNARQVPQTTPPPERVSEEEQQEVLMDDFQEKLNSRLSNNQTVQETADEALGETDDGEGDPPDPESEEQRERIGQAAKDESFIGLVFRIAKDIFKDHMADPGFQNAALFYIAGRALGYDNADSAMAAGRVLSETWLLEAEKDAELRDKLAEWKLFQMKENYKNSLKDKGRSGKVTFINPNTGETISGEFTKNNFIKLNNGADTHQEKMFQAGYEIYDPQVHMTQADRSKFKTDMLGEMEKSVNRLIENIEDPEDKKLARASLTPQALKEVINTLEREYTPLRFRDGAFDAQVIMRSAADKYIDQVTSTGNIKTAGRDLAAFVQAEIWKAEIDDINGLPESALNFHGTNKTMGAETISHLAREAEIYKNIINQDRARDPSAKPATLHSVLASLHEVYRDLPDKDRWERYAKEMYESGRHDDIRVGSGFYYFAESMLGSLIDRSRQE